MMHQLMTGKSRQQDSIESPSAVGAVVDHDLHIPTSLQGRKKACRECLVQRRRAPSGRAVETTNGCPVCKVATINAYIVYKKMRVRSHQKPDTHLQFRLYMMRQLTGKSRQRDSIESPSAVAAVVDHNLHIPTRLQGR
ncbi:hypothetical protein PoB_003041000 [Plakobranchus ocellatus]|uniref:Uncharacterized protein n=1 Tax=Plakobranchus ocellatus TaxID=259542 RepID=A0AAV4A965_9GAST|nr:hypothetical protein PoB_003041000 [Plakobranchus ocellatus]